MLQTTSKHSGYRAATAFAIWLMALNPFCLAQVDTTGTIGGTVTDRSGAAIVGAKISIANTQTGTIAETVTNPDGGFSKVGLPSGNYDLTVTSTGFNTFKESGIYLEPAGTYNVNAILTPGDVATTITVAANPSQVQTITSEISSTVSGEEAEALPLNGRNYQQLGSLMPGVINTSPVATMGTGGYNTFNALNVNGAGTGGSLYIIDGVWNLDTIEHNQTTIMPNPDEIAEVKVLQNNYDARYTLMGTGVIVVQTKSGTDTFHGGAWEFLRNTVLDARNFYSPTVPPERRNMFGWNLGGPAFIPHLYRRDNHKTFFYVNQQFVRQAQESVLQGATATAAMRSGIFPSSIKDPNGGVFPNNTIPISRINTSALAFMNALAPLPNNITSAFDNYINTNPSYTRQDNYTIKADHNLTSNWRLSGEYLYERQVAADPSAARMGSPFDLNWDEYDTRNHVAQLQLTQILSPSMTNQVSFGTSSYDGNHDFAGIHLLSQVPGYSESLPFTGGFLQNYLPVVTFSGGWSEFGASSCCVVPHAKSLENSLTDDWSWLRGKHFLHAGINIVMGRERQWNTGSAVTNGSFAFNGNITGNSIADYLLGDASSFSQSSTAYRKTMTYPIVTPYFEDQWKATRRLTISAGVRWLFMPWANTQAGYSSSFVPALYNPADAPKVAANGTITPTPTYNPGNGMVLNGENGVPLNFNDKHQYYFAPVLGFALDVFGNGRSALRGGYGITYNKAAEDGCAQSCINYPLAQSTSLVNPHFPDVTGGTASVPTAPATSGVDLQNYQAAKVQAYSLSWQQQIGSQWFLSVAGAGDISQHVPGPVGGPNININTPGPVPGYDFNPLVNTGNYANSYFAPYQGYGNIIYYNSWGKNMWNALEVLVRHPIGSNLYITLAYTWSHNLTNYNVIQSDYNLQGSYGNSSLNTPQVLTYSVIYTEPWLKAAAGWKRAALAGWKVSDMTTIQSGSSLTLGLSTSHNGLATRPNVLGPVAIIGQMNEWFNTKEFAQPAAGFYGNAGVGTILSPGVVNFNMAAYKDFRLRENLNLQFRAEFFNVFNHTNLNGPNTSYGAGGFGQITSAKDPREGEMALKVTF